MRVWRDVRRQDWRVWRDFPARLTRPARHTARLARPARPARPHSSNEPSPPGVSHHCVDYGAGRCWKSTRKNPRLSSSQMRMTDPGNVRCVAFTLNMCAYSSGNSRRIRFFRVRLFRQMKCISNSLDGVEENTMDAFAPIHTNTKRKNKREIAFGIYVLACF